MKIKKPSFGKCIDGELHDWLIVSEEPDFGIEHRWCAKCGGLTQFLNKKVVKDGKNAYFVGLKIFGEQVYIGLPLCYNCYRKWGKKNG